MAQVGWEGSCREGLGRMVCQSFPVEGRVVVDSELEVGAVG